jgi:hypothetical protein
MLTLVFNKNKKDNFYKNNLKCLLRNNGFPILVNSNLELLVECKAKYLQQQHMELTTNDIDAMVAKNKNSK